MFRRVISLSLIFAAMTAVIHLDLFGIPGNPSPTLLLGFLLLSGYIIGFFFWRLGLPWITGYICAGLFLGPYFFSFYRQPAVEELGFLNSLALAFIAFCAGGELKWEKIKKNLKSIIYLICGVTSVVFVGVTLTVYVLSGFLSFMDPYPTMIRLVISMIFGVIAVARSPSSAIAIISETRAQGKYTDTVLSVTIAMDVVIIVFFAVVVSFGESMVRRGGSVSPSIVVVLFFEICLAFFLGLLLGKAIIFLIDRLKVEFPVVIAAMGFMVIRFSHFFGDYLHESYNLNLKIEPLLICMAAGFVVQNFSCHGNWFLIRMDKVSLPIYVAFFTITGATINIEVLKEGWILGLIIVFSRMLMIFIGSSISGRLSGDRPDIYKNSWLGFITQAGVSLGLLSEIVRRFPEFGESIQSILIAAITVNQLIGPIAFKYGLKKVGEIGGKDICEL
jgi:Kef-type K+ transport system membrane component KefB